MKKRISMRNIIGRRSYNTIELAKAVHVHPQTIRSWLSDGLQPIDPKQHHPLIMGSEVRRYYNEREASRKVKLLPGQVYCLKCKRATNVTNARIVDTKRRIGHSERSYMLVGRCDVCRAEVSRFGNSQTKLLVEGKGTNIDDPAPLNRSLLGGKELYGNSSRN